MELVNTISRSQSLAMGMNTYCRLSIQAAHNDVHESDERRA
jgi:hypothetical protein